MIFTVCPQGHEIRSSADRDADGWCKRCRKAKNVAYRTRQRAAIELVTVLESLGVDVVNRPNVRTLAEMLASGYHGNNPLKR
ncbi:hypothetical protein ACXPWS_09155 [Mycobacterium sp. BMJ-28]